MKPRPPERHSTFYNLADALGRPGCALCRLTAKAVQDDLNALLYENVNDPGARRAMTDALGFCAAHAGLAAQLNDAFGIAILYEALCREAAARTGRGEQPAQRDCPACRVARETGRRYADEFCGRLGETDLREKFLASDGFCLAHFQIVAQRITDEAARALVQSHQAATFRALADQLAAFIKKHDYKQTAPFGPEADAWQRALEKFAGRIQ